MTDFAKGLAAGTIIAPANTSWWPRHTRAMMSYLAMSGTKPVSGQQAVAISLETGAREWELLIPKEARHGLMLEHVQFEMALVDAVRKNDPEGIETLGNKLFANTTQISAAMGVALKEFPEALFDRLLRDHVALFATAVRKKIEGSVPPSAKMEANTLELAAFTAEWL